VTGNPEEIDFAFELVATNVLALTKISHDKPTSRYLSACLALDYFRVADDLGVREQVVG